MKYYRLLAMSITLITALVVTTLNSPVALASSDFSPAYQEEEEESYFCSGDSDFQHPVAAGIADLFKTNYEEIIGFFCKGTGDGVHAGFGQIMLAYLTADLSEEDASAEDILNMRADGIGWGQIWQDLGLVGKPDDAGRPAGAGKPEGVGKPEDPPADAGKPEGAGKPTDPPADP